MKTAVVYVASENYCDDAGTSRDSVRKWEPSLPLILATDSSKQFGGWDRQLSMSARQYPDVWYRDSTRWCLEAFDILKPDYDSLLCLDSDTLVDGPLADMLRLAERFDICMTHGVNRHTTGKVYDIPDAFPEFEIGVMLVQTNERVHHLFRDWHDLYENYPLVYQNNDQGPLRDALWISDDIQFFVLPPEFHARWGFGVNVVSRVRILHGRSPGYPNSQAAAEINRCGGRRLFWPGGMWRPLVGVEEFGK